MSKKMMRKIMMSVLAGAMLFNSGIVSAADITDVPDIPNRLELEGTSYKYGKYAVNVNTLNEAIYKEGVERQNMDIVLRDWLQDVDNRLIGEAAARGQNVSDINEAIAYLETKSVEYSAAIATEANNRQVSVNAINEAIAYLETKSVEYSAAIATEANNRQVSVNAINEAIAYLEKMDLQHDKAIENEAVAREQNVKDLKEGIEYLQDNVYTKEEANKEFLNQEEADARYVQIGADVIENEDGSTTAKTEISDNFVVEETTTTTATGTSTSTKVTINEGDKAQLVVGGGEQNDKIVFGQHSSWYSDQKGFFFGGGDGVHNDDTANAYIKEDGTIMGAKGKFKVDEEGNVTGGTYNGIDIVGMNQRLDRTNAKINKVGAGAAALAALHPLEYDPDDKLTFSAGMGNYAGENAAALGAFYRPNEKFMVSLGGTMGNGENMVNLGLSIGLDKPNGLAKLSKRELIQKVNAMEAEMAEMKAMLQELMAKK